MSTTFRFGTITSPCRAMPERTQSQQEQNDDRGNLDPERLVQCPFDKNHQIRTCRFPYHLLKCKKNHPELASELKTCPYNARHLVSKHELARHTETCEDRIAVDPEEAAGVNRHCPWQVPVSTWVNPNATEDWDLEADIGAKPFCWGVDTQQDIQPERELSNRLGQSYRPPTNFPWPDFNM